MRSALNNRHSELPRDARVFSTKPAGWNRQFKLKPRRANRPKPMSSGSVLSHRSTSSVHELRKGLPSKRLRLPGTVDRVWSKNSADSPTLLKKRLHGHGAKHLSPTDVHVDVGNVPAIVRTGTATSLHCLQDWPCSFPFCCTPRIVSDLPHHRDADEIYSEAVAVDVDHSCRADQSTTTRSYRVPFRVDYVRAYLPAAEGGNRRNGDVSYSYMLSEK